MNYFWRIPAHQTLGLTFCLLIIGFQDLCAKQSINLIDSLENAKKLSPSQYVRTTARLINEQSSAELGDQLKLFLEEALQTAREERLELPLAAILEDWGTYQVIQEANTYEALKAYQEALDIYEKEDAIVEQVVVARLMGNIYKDRGRLEDALNYYLTSLDDAEQLDNKSEMARALGSIGLIYKNQEKYSEAVGYFQQALEILNDLSGAESDLEAIAITYSNMGVCESELGNYEQAIKYFEEALKIDESLGSEYGIAFDNFSIAETYLNEGKHQEALGYIKKAIGIFEEFEDTASLLACRIVEGQLLHKVGESRKALFLLMESTEEAQALGMKPLVKQGYEQLYKAFEDLENTPKAYLYYKKYIAIKDSISSAEIASSIDRLKGQYDAEKKAEEIEKLKIEAALKQSQIDQQKQFFFFTAFGILLLLILLGVIYGRYQIKQHANQELEEQQKIIEDSNEKIMGSIRYGSRIQKALITASEPIEKAFPESFIFLKPRDVVTGDFYWYVNRGDEQILAAIDCTGHGVPGAFMTVFGYSLLNKIVNNDGVDEPSQILALLGFEVMKLFQTQEEDQVIQDGMDMALVKINQKEKKLYFAGANRPLILHNKEGQQQIKGDRIGLGGKKMLERGKPFNTFEYDYEPGDTFYIFSDGYADQFGGPESRKFMTKRFRELLNSLQKLSMQAQMKKLELTLKEWMGNERQTDDMIIIGVKLGENGHEVSEK